MSSLLDPLVAFGTGNFYLSNEMQALWMAVQGAVAIRHGPNKEGKLHWFHAFCLSMLAGFAGGWLGFIWMGLPTSMIASDFGFAACIVAYIVVNHTPGDVGYMLCNSVPGHLITTIFAQLFRSMGIMRFCAKAFVTFQDTPSPYYPIPVFGPILYATLLGNMAGLVMKGLEGHIANGVPWPAQNGLFCAGFYHFYVHDTKGPIGTYLRYFMPIRALFGDALTDKEFASCFVTIFMQVVGILQLPMFLGPKFSPFGVSLLNPFFDSNTWTVGRTDSVYGHRQEEKEAIEEASASSKRKKKTH